MVIKQLSNVPFEETTGYEGVTKQILIGAPDGSDEIVMRHFSLKPGGATPYHQHDFPHLAMVTQGTGTVIDSEGGEHALAPGDSIYIPDNEVHGFRNSASEPMNFICVVPARGEQ